MRLLRKIVTKMLNGTKNIRINVYRRLLMLLEKPAASTSVIDLV